MAIQNVGSTPRVTSTVTGVKKSLPKQTSAPAATRVTDTAPDSQPLPQTAVPEMPADENKPVAKKSASKKTSAKKSVAKKTAAKKSASKKTTAKTSTGKKTATEVAEQILKGGRNGRTWGSGRELDERLVAAGYDLEEVRREIYRLRAEKAAENV